MPTGSSRPSVRGDLRIETWGAPLMVFGLYGDGPGPSRDNPPPLFQEAPDAVAGVPKEDVEDGKGRLEAVSGAVVDELDRRLERQADPSGGERRRVEQLLSPERI